MPKLPFVVVKWNDAWADDENFQTMHGIRTTHEPMPVETFGYLIVDDEEGVSVANESSTQDGHDVYRGRTFIPRAMVKDVVELKLTKKKKAPTASTSALTTQVKEVTRSSGEGDEPSGALLKPSS